MNFGVAVTTYNRPDRLAKTVEAIEKYTPAGIPLAIVNDGGGHIPALPSGRWTVINYTDNRGIAAAKNRCIEELVHAGVEHLFLFDDDTRPTALDWWKPYVESVHLHLMFQFESGPSHWGVRKIGSSMGHTMWDKPRGCMLYAHRDVIHEVGGMSLAFGKHGGEHGNWSDRINKAGLSLSPYMDVESPSIECDDQHERGISSVDYAADSWWKYVDDTRIPQYQGYDSECNVPVLVPFRDDRGARLKACVFLRDHYWTMQHFGVYSGESPAGPFNRSAAINDAADWASEENWDVAIIADTDAWVPPQNLQAAVNLARKTGKLVSALDAVYELDEATSDAVIDKGFAALDHTKVERVRTDELSTQSLMLVVPRPLWEAVRGFDERFQSWGGEDNSFWRACEIIGGTPERISGPAYHLWHPSAIPADKSRNKDYLANWNRWLAYKKTRTVPEMLELVKGNRLTSGS